MYVSLDQGGSKQNLREILSVDCSYHTPPISVGTFFGLNMLTQMDGHDISTMCSLHSKRFTVMFIHNRVILQIS
jgi:hypothetical protein